MTLIIGDSRDVSSLFEVYVLDFNDNYHRLPTEPTSELEAAARKIRRRYKKIADYLNAVAVYQEYMTLLILKHGGPKLFKIKLKNDMINDYVPPKPRMKNTSVNKYILKQHIVLSNINNNEIDEEGLEEIIDEYIDKKCEEFMPVKSNDKSAEKFLNKELPSTIVKKMEAVDNLTYLENYFRQKNVKINKEKEKNMDIPTLSQLMKGDYEKKYLKDTSEEDDVIFYNGSFFHRSTVDELEAYKKLAECGWDSMKLMKHKDVSKKVTKIMKNNKKKDKKKKKKDKSNDDFIVNIITDGGYDDFEQFSEEMLNFTADQVFRF